MSNILNLIRTPQPRWWIAWNKAHTNYVVTDESSQIPPGWDRVALASAPTQNRIDVLRAEGCNVDVRMRYTSGLV